MSFPIVLATAKIHILKQFTTSVPYSVNLLLLCLLLQRYTFWSNSQLFCNSTRSHADCACYCKDTHFEAIHNAFTDDQVKLLLCLLLQRYTFWSNSQLVMRRISWRWHCACYCKDTHFEAIHNKWKQYLRKQRIVLATAKIHILKQFTTREIPTAANF